MKVLVYAFAYLSLIAVAGLGFIALTDTPVEQTEIIKEIPASNFVKAQ